MIKIYMIVNLVAGKAIISENLGSIINEFTKIGGEVTVHPTQSSEDASEAAYYACENNFDIIVCAGGDGTLCRCLQGIMKSKNRLTVGYIPTGSTNDFAQSLDIPRNIMDAVRWIIDGKPKNCDVGKFNDDYFMYIAAFGAFTNITYETPQRIKNAIGHAAYILNGLMQIKTIRSKRMRIEYDDIVMEDDFLFGMVTNSASVAGMLSINDFMLDDGVFEVVLIKKPVNLVQLNQIIRSLMNISEEIDKDYIKFFRTDKITFTCLDEEPATWTRDGEFGGNDMKCVISDCQQAVSFMICDCDETKFMREEIIISEPEKNK
ncbi:MAG: YegS/Rv2252/BmrU family lipid kinase [Prevotella sp.]|nr:YegS/Rv2252/BmrU family lipid kinase [Alistipes senegalensis]MCM1357325.1 YegS/Rv2252/BmrU family lipid kinase [Prevotella sp.]MCM1472768.1 YegS/Rv2252/BmrU family lipid kinase [Muribaculaceae bacterium]